MKRLLLILCLYSLALEAQLPDTDILLFKEIPGKPMYYSAPINITKRVGYDNQPCFSPDGKELLFVSIEDSTQSDVWSYNIQTKKKKQVTHTKVSEYSPTYIDNGKNISVVRVDEDSAQRFYRMPYTTAGPAVVVPNTDSIGYSGWVNDSLLFMFIVGEPSTLVALDLKSGTRKFICNEPGRCMKVHPITKQVYFVDKSDTAKWVLCKIDPTDFIIQKIITMPQGSEDFAFFSNGQLITAAKSTLYKLDESKEAWIAEGQKILPTKSDYFRIAISPDNKYVAVVIRNDHKK